jgi:hypothetical protein
MTKQRPKASTFRVGTHMQGYVVKTRRAGQSAKRIKYWAKQSVKQAKAAKARPTKRKATKLTKSTNKPKLHRTLRGGAMSVAQVIDELVDEESALMKHYEHMCDEETMGKIRLISKQANKYREKFGDDRVVEYIYGSLDGFTSGNAAVINQGAWLNAYAILAAKLKLAEDAGGGRGWRIDVRDIKTNQKYLTVYRADNVYASIQAEWPEFVDKIVYKGKLCSHDSTFEDFEEALFMVLGLPPKQ